MKSARIAILTLCTLSTLCLAQSKPADPPAKIPVPISLTRDQLWVAMHKRDMAQKQISDLSAQFAQMQSQAQQKMQSLNLQEKQAESEIDSAKTKVFSEMKLDPAKYDLDVETMEVSPKPAPPNEAKK